MRRMKLNYGLRLTSCLSIVALAVACASAGSEIVVTVAPETPYTLEDLVATVVDDGTATYSYLWSQDGTVRADLTTSTIANAETTKHEVWLVELLDTSGGTISSDTVTILNSPPAAPVVSVPSAPWLGQPIQCAVDTPSADDDNDTITYTASWTRNGSAYNSATATTFANDTVPAGQSQAGDVFVCTVTASDGEAQADAVSNIATVGDCPPTQDPMTFTFTGSMESYVVPTCVATVTIETWGAQGTGPGGANGGYAAGTLAVTTGQTLYVFVGGSAGFNGGGIGQAVNPAHGGGASDVRVGDTVLDNRVIVGGGGGGGPMTDVGTYVGGTGGGGTCGANYCGGGGAQGYSGAASPGGATGGAGVTGTHGSGGGGGGLQSGGGGACQTYNQPTTCGGTGQLGVGGAGDAVAVQACFDLYGGTAGGGGGYWGGGGSATGYCGGGAGGGGSSWTGTLTSPVMNGGVRTGDGQVIITPL